MELDVKLIIDIAMMVLRIQLPIFAVIIIYACFASMRRHRRPEKPLVTLELKGANKKVPVLFWENSIGRSKSSDICIFDMAVSRQHCVLLRREEGWFISDLGSKAGTFVNGIKAVGRTQVLIDDEIRVGTTTLILKRGQEFKENLRPSWFFSKASTKESMKQYKLMLMISFFHLFMAVEAFASTEYKDYTPFIIFGAFTALIWFFFLISSYAFNRVNFEIEAFASFLSGIGVMLLVRQEVRSAWVQLAACALGMIVFSVLVKILENPDRAYHWRWGVMIASFVLLVINLLFAKVSYGSGNWIAIGPITIQPSEFVKIAFIFVGAAALDKLETTLDLIVFIGFSAICVGSLALMHDFGTALIYFITFLMIAFMRSGDYKTIVLAIVAAVLAGFVVLSLLDKKSPDGQSYVAQRFSGWWDAKIHGYTQDYFDNSGYQQSRSLTYAVSGGLTGVGVGSGFLKYIFASESDLVFALTSEELGMVISFTIVISLIALALYARAVTTRSRSTIYSISACCAAGMLIVQTILNVLGSMDVIPLTGVTLPFISAGGSSVVSCWGLMAFIKAADERTYAAKRIQPRDR